MSDSMKRVGVSELRKMNAMYLKNLSEPLEICTQDLQPVRVLVPYALYLEWQAEFKKLLADCAKKSLPDAPEGDQGVD